MALDCDNEYNGIKRDCGGSPGGVLTFYATSRNNLTGFQFSETNPCLITSATLVEGITFSKYGIRRESSNFLTSANGNGTYTTTLTVLIDNMTGEKNCELQKFETGDAIALVKLKTRRYFLLGVDEVNDEDVALILGDGTQADTGTTPDDINGYTLVLVHNTYHYAYEVTEEVYLQLTGQATTAPATFPLNSKSDTVGTVSDSNVDGMVVPVEVVKAAKATKATVNKTA